MKYLAIFLATYAALSTAAWHHETRKHTQTTRVLLDYAQRNVALVEELERVHFSKIRREL
jgi:hypothetical protein